MNQQIVLALSLVLLALCVPSLAYVNGALPESCYNHEVIHTQPIVFTRYDLLPCPDPCFYQLDVKLVLDMSDINNVIVSDIPVTKYDCGQMYQVNVKQVGNNAFQGFLVQARDDTMDFNSSSTIYGTWVEHPDLLYKPLNCSTNESMAASGTTFPNSATHKGRITASTEDLVVPLYWMPPDAPSNPIAFWYTIVQQQATNFFPVKGPVLIPGSICTTMSLTTPLPTTPPLTTPPPPTTPPPTTHPPPTTPPPTTHPPPTTPPPTTPPPTTPPPPLTTPPTTPAVPPTIPALTTNKEKNIVLASNGSDSSVVDSIFGTCAYLGIGTGALIVIIIPVVMVVYLAIKSLREIEQTK